ncbi:glycosyltransferase family 2 protein [Microbacterium sp. ZXX196]|uniref:glycosyltransferase n=1 Tax=Microbacterium sp. ZXX196 TaxID=2609291 RepID=UPI0018ACDDCA|nr:glycosyltransferase [Microbacterium sp. ZXX196]
MPRIRRTSTASGDSSPGGRVRVATEQIDALVGRPEVAGGVLDLELEGVDALRVLALPRDPVARVTRMVVRLAHWEAPVPRWRGRLGQIRALSGFSSDFDARGSRASATVTVTEPTSVTEIAAALIGVFAPDAPHAGAGFPLVAVAPGAGRDALALLPTRTVPPVEPMVDRLQGVGLFRADVAIGGPRRLAEEMATHHLSTDEAAHGRPRTELPVLDLLTHNPIGRPLTFQPSPPARRLVVDGNRARVLPVEHATAHPVEFDVRRPLDAPTVRALRRVESIDLSGLSALPEGLAARFAEITATDTILHSLPAAVDVPAEALAPALADVIRRPYRQQLGLERDLRAVEGRRLAMHEHGGFFRLASAVASATGTRYLPRVSVVLSTMRSELVPGVLEMMARQTYPHMEVVVVVHGVPAPSLDGVDLRDLAVRIVEVPGSVLFGGALAEGVRHASGDLITKLDDDDWYSEHHVSDLVLAALYSRADIVGKTTEFLYFEEVGQTVHRTFATERYHDQVAGGAMLLSRSTFDALGGWRPTPNSTDRSVLIRVETQGGVAYRTQSLGYMYIRHASKHTWERTASQLVQGSFEQWRGWRSPEVDGA